MLRSNAQASPVAMLDNTVEQSTQRNVRNERNVRVQDQSKSSSVSYAAEAVDNGKSGLSICAEGHPHGENATCYVQHKCRCAECREGRAQYEFWRKRMLDAGKELLVDATGSQRRIRALAAIGWSQRMLGDRFGKSPSWFSSVLTKTRVTPATRALVIAMYDELAMTVPVGRDRYEKARISKTRNYAAKSGWAPPLAWDDDVIDNPAGEPFDAARKPAEVIPFLQRLDTDLVREAIDGRQPALAPRERREAVKVLHERRWSERRIGKWLGCDKKTVERIRAELGLPIYDQMTIRDQNWKATA